MTVNTKPNETSLIFPLIRRAAKEEGEGGSGGDGRAGQGVWWAQETHCGLDGAYVETYNREGAPGLY